MPMDISAPHTTVTPDQRQDVPQTTIPDQQEISRESTTNMPAYKRLRTLAVKLMSKAKEVGRTVGMPNPVKVEQEPSQIDHNGKKVQAVSMYIAKPGIKVDMSMYQDPSSPSRYVFRTNVAGMKALHNAIQKKTGIVTQALGDKYGMRPSAFKAKAKYGSKDNLGGQAVTQSRFESMLVSLRNIANLEEFVGNFIRDVLTDENPVVPNENVSQDNFCVVGTHISPIYDGSMNEDQDSDLLVVPFDFYGDGEGLYIAADTHISSSNVLSEAINNPDKLKEANWSETTVEVLGPIPDGIQKLATPSHWNAVSTCQADCREDAIEKLIECIKKSGAKAELKHGVVKVTNEERKLPERPPAGTDKEFYADYDDESGLWCVFGDESGFAYASYASEQQAEEKAESMNKNKATKFDVDKERQIFDREFQAKEKDAFAKLKKNKSNEAKER